MTSVPFAAEVAACRAAQEPWSRLSVRDRLRPVRELRHLLVEQADTIFATVAADVGRSAVEVLGTELLPTAAALKFLEQQAARLLAPRRIPGRLRPTWLLGCRDAVHRRPWGVVGIIGTWNYPIYLNVVQAAQALVAGNAVLWKPSENVPKTADLTHRLVLDAGFPPGLFAKLPATREAGPLLAESEVDYVVFTGSDAVGRRLAARLGERLVPSTMELSGCDAMFVMEDADVELAAKGAWFGVTLNRGQTCIAVRRIFVQRGRYSSFIEALGRLAAGARPVSLVTRGQVEEANQFVANAIDRGATVIGSDPTPNPLPWGERGLNPAPPGGGKGAGGLSSGFTFTPTILADATTDMLVCREASFAPVAAILRFDTDADAVALAVQCPFGLAASVFTGDPERGLWLAARIPAGHVTVNDVIAPTAHPATPFGGRGASGWGVTQGAEGLLAMTMPQAVTVRGGSFRPHLDDAASPDPATADVLRGLLRATHGRGWRHWLGGAVQLIRGLRRKKQ
jgi:acyl-CoA reductase-like NAD-dependent aldehyde dehydrogenase